MVKEKNRKVLYILDYYLPHVGGVEIVFDNIIKHLPDNYKATILTSHHDKKIPKYEKKDNYEIFRVGSRLGFIFQGLPLAIRLSKKSDIIHCSNYSASWLGGILGLFTKKPRILTVHEIFGKLWYTFMGWKGFFFHIFERSIYTFFKFKKYTTVSYYTKNALRISHGITDSKLQTIYNGVEYDHWERTEKKEKEAKMLREKFNIKNNDFLILSYGRAGVSKGMVDLIPTFNAYKRKNKEAKMIIILSPAEQYDIIMKQHKKSAYKNDIQIIPSVKYKELPSHILMADVVLLPTRVEGFGFAIAETNSLGIPLVTCSVGSVPEVVSGKTILVEPNNIEQYICAINKIRNKKINKLPEKKFTWKESVEQYIRLYEKIIQEGK